jgi:two-component system, cell cycle response regulator DivK
MKRKILIIEDNADNMYLATFLLEKAGYAISQAFDGKAGIASARTDRPDLILLDIQLPVMDGYAVARALQSDDLVSDIPIVAVTSHAMAGDRETVMAAGCTGYIEKPISPENFVLQMEQYLR